MPNAVTASKGAAYACHCLNVRIQTGTTNQAPPLEVVNDPSFIQVFVGDGISIKHPQLTLRSRQRLAEIPGTNRCVRSITLKCLVCQASAYRVLQEVPVDFEGEDGLILPTLDYVEQEVLKSPHGWIQVNSTLLTGDAIAQAEAKAEFSPTFDLVVPPVATLPTPVATHMTPQQSMATNTSSPPAPTPPTYFDHLKPVLHHPPYTPSHPAFLHLAKLAREESQARRAAAENHVAEIIRQKTAEIESGDAAIRKQVEALWRTYKEAVKEAQGEAPTRAIGRSTSRSRERRSGRSASPAPAHGTPVSVRDFVPVSVPARLSPSPSTRASALSASLVTSGFHHPRAQHENTSSGAKTPDSETETTTLSNQSEATLVQPPPSEVISVLQFRRNVDEGLNTQQSYRYFRNLEEDMARAKKQREEAEANLRVASQQEIDTPERVAPGAPPVATVKEIRETLDVIQELPSETNGVNGSNPSKSTTERGREKKGKRKVTFDIEPDVVAIKDVPQPDSERTEETEQDAQGHREEMLFEMEDHEDGINEAEQAPPTLPLLEQPSDPRARRIGRRSYVMPEELSTLRPSSLPVPSHMRPINRPLGVDSQSLAMDMMQSLPPYSNPLSRQPQSNGSKSPLSPSKAGNVSGHFSSDGRTWQSFTRGHPVSPTSIPEESENETTETSEEGYKSKQSVSAQVKSRRKYNADKYEQYLATMHNLGGIPGSMPIQIHFKTNAKQPLSLASYQPQSALAQQQQTADALPTLLPLNGHRKTSSNTIRKALYAERDRVRSVDPGINDFTSSDEEQGTDETEESSEDEAEKARMEAYLATSRGRKRALKILQARSELPDSGMWRSLAN